MRFRKTCEAMGGRYESSEYYGEKCVFKNIGGVSSGEVHVYNYPEGFRLTVSDEKGYKLIDIHKPSNVLEDVSKKYDPYLKRMFFEVKSHFAQRKLFDLEIEAFPKEKPDRVEIRIE